MREDGHPLTSKWDEDTVIDGVSRDRVRVGAGWDAGDPFVVFGVDDTEDWRRRSGGQSIRGHATGREVVAIVASVEPHLVGAPDLGDRGDRRAVPLVHDDCLRVRARGDRVLAAADAKVLV